MAAGRWRIGGLGGHGLSEDERIGWRWGESVLERMALCLLQMNVVDAVVMLLGEGKESRAGYGHASALRDWR